MTKLSTAEHAARYIALGWGLCSIPPGTKGPTDAGWNNPANIIKTPWQAQAICGARPAHGIGIVHSASGTCAVDVDHLGHFRDCLAELGTDPDTLFAGAPRIIGKEGRDKAIFRLPPGEFKTHKLVWPPRAQGEKPVTIFELRAGIVQDVLPPSIHPDTKQPYRWREGCSPWDHGIPTLPPALIAMWRDWENFKPQLMAVCPWFEQKAPAPKPRARSTGEHSNVIGQFNDAHDIVTMLEAHGYKQRGKRWLAPTSSSGLAGVTVFEDGTHCFSHHASDPLNDGHAHDAFSVFCLLDHRGDVTAAIRAAAKLLGLSEVWPPEPIPAPAPSVEFIERSRKAKPANDAPVAEPAPPASSVVERIETSGVPSELLRVPGVLGEVVELANRTAPYPQPILAVQTALALGSVVLGRRYCSTKNNRTSLYFVNVAKSGMGKNHARDVIERILESAGEDVLIGPPSYTSPPAILSALLRQPCCISIMDEFGDMLGYASAKGNHQKAATLSTLKELWGNLHGTQRPDQYSEMGLSKKDRESRANEARYVRNPALSVLGMTTPGKFYGSLNKDAIEGGFLNRLIIAESTAQRTLPRDAEPLDIPASITAWCKAARADRGGGNLTGVESATMEPQTVRVEYTRDAEAILHAYSVKLVADQNALEKESEGLADLVSRSREKAMRLAVILAASVNVNRPLITPECMQWSVAYAQWTTEQTLEAVQKHMASGPFGELYATILELFKKSDARGLADRELSQRSRSWRQTEPRLREQVLKALVADGHISLAEFPKPERGPARRAWVWSGLCLQVSDAA
jgi:hypothetical protein